MDILDDRGVSKLSAKVKKKKVNYSFKCSIITCLDAMHMEIVCRRGHA